LLQICCRCSNEQFSIQSMIVVTIMIWDIPADAVEWKDGKAYPAGPNAGSFEPLPLAEIALKSGRTGGPISAELSINAQGAGPGFATHICDVEVDKETGQVKILRYTAVQDVGRAIHPSYVEGQIQGGVTQGIGWALNEDTSTTRTGVSITRASSITACRSLPTCR
jgi:CO/xanthine dehydrogenase Mo-binding subunit